MFGLVLEFTSLKNMTFKQEHMFTEISTYYIMQKCKEGILCIGKRRNVV